jgi:hypothetical protein
MIGMTGSGTKRHSAARSQAETTGTPTKREYLLRISRAYERLAATAAKRENNQSKNPDDQSD